MMAVPVGQRAHGDGCALNLVAEDTQESSAVNEFVCSFSLFTMRRDSCRKLPVEWMMLGVFLVPDLHFRLWRINFRG